MTSNSILYDPLVYELYDSAQNSPELDRVLANMKRHIRKGTYDTARTVKSVDRYVVETAAIELHKTHGGDSISPRKKIVWFTRYPAKVRRTVAEKIVSGWEREIRNELEELG